MTKMVGRWMVLAAMALALVAGACSQQTAPPAPSKAPSPSPSASTAPTSVAPKPSAPPAQVIKLDFADHTASVGVRADFNRWYFNELQQRTNGKLQIEVHWAGSLFLAPDILAAVGRGAVPMGFSSMGVYNVKEAPLNAFQVQPGYSKSYKTVLLAEVDMWNTDPSTKAEFERLNLVPLVASGAASHNLVTRNKPIKTLDDLKGLRMRGIGGYSDLIKSFGAVPVSVAAADSYTAIEHGTIDGAEWNPDNIERYGLLDVSNTFTWADLGALGGCVYIMNRNEWSKLPADIQKVFLDLTVPATIKQAEMTMSDEEGRIIDKMKAKGYTINTLSDSDKQKVKEAALVIEQNAAKKLDAAGIPGAKVLDTWLSLIKKYEGK